MKTVLLILLIFGAVFYYYLYINNQQNVLSNFRSDENRIQENTTPEKKLTEFQIYKKNVNKKFQEYKTNN